MDFFFYFFGFFFGASIGSFYLTLAERILFFFYSKERKNFSFFGKVRCIVFKRSACNNCKKEISAFGLIPVFGYCFAKGKCSDCKTEIPIRYPLVEILFGTSFILFYYTTATLLFCIFVIFLFGHLTISLVTDWKYFSLDYENIPFILGFGIASNYFLEGRFFNLNDIFVFFGFLSFYFCLYFIYKKGIGLGDVFFAPVFAFLSSHPWWMLFLNSSYVSAIVFTFLFREKRVSLKKTPIPMGAYFSIGHIITYFARSVFLKMQNI